MEDYSRMENRIELEKQNKPNDQIVELILDNCKATHIKGLTDEFVNLEMLSIINVGLTSLAGFPNLPSLRKLELSDNRLSGGLDLLHGCPKLQHLNLSGNRIKEFDSLAPLKTLPLTVLDLYGCEVTNDDEYRKRVFDLLPNLHSLDGYDRNEREVNDESDEDSEDDSEEDNQITRDDDDLEVDEDDPDDDDDVSASDDDAAEDAGDDDEVSIAAEEYDDEEDDDDMDEDEEYSDDDDDEMADEDEENVDDGDEGNLVA